MCFMGFIEGLVPDGVLYFLSESTQLEGAIGRIFRKKVAVS